MPIDRFPVLWLPNVNRRVLRGDVSNLLQARFVNVYPCEPRGESGVDLLTNFFNGAFEIIRDMRAHSCQLGALDDEQGLSLRGTEFLQVSTELLLCPCQQLCGELPPPVAPAHIVLDTYEVTAFKMFVRFSSASIRFSH